MIILLLLSLFFIIIVTLVSIIVFDYHGLTSTMLYSNTTLLIKHQYIHGYCVLLCESSQ